MQNHHSTLSLAGLTLHRIDFDPGSFSANDLLWLPHHQKLAHAVTKRQSEHLAGRLAAFYALQARGVNHIADIGPQRQPLWPTGWHGSISHSGRCALAVVARHPVGVDIENIIAAEVCEEIGPGIITPQEGKTLEACALSFPLALTLAFSAKESLYKALSRHVVALPDFHCARIIGCGHDTLTLQLSAAFAPTLAVRQYLLAWQRCGDSVITVASG